MQPVLIKKGGGPILSNSSRGKDGDGEGGGLFAKPVGKSEYRICR